MSRAELHPDFVHFVVKHKDDEEIPDLASWPYVKDDFIRVRKKIREAIEELKALD